MSQYAILDLETTGLDPDESEVTEVAIIITNDEFEEIGSFHSFVNIEGQIPEFVTNLTGITKEDCESGMSQKEIKSILTLVLDGKILVCQNAPFDMSFLDKCFNIIPERFICTRTLTAFAQPFESASLKPTCDRLGIELEGAHRAMNDTKATLEVLKYWDRKDVYIENAITESSDRPLSYIPQHTHYTMNQNHRRDISSISMGLYDKCEIGEV